MIVDDPQIQEWADLVDPRVEDLAHRLTAPGPKASALSASEIHEVVEFISEAIVAIPALVAETRRLRSGACVVGLPCQKHHGAVHGREAEELRAGIERIRAEAAWAASPAISAWRSALQTLLDRVDARDSLAFLEKTSP